MTEEEKKKIEEQQANAVVPDVNAVEQPTVADNATVAPEVQQQPSESQRYLDEIFKRYDERKKENEKADKRDRIREAIGGIGDVASALAKLHYTTEYAPYVPSENMSEKARQRAAVAKANRDKNLDQWMHYVLNVAGKKQAAEQAERNAALQQKRIDAAEAKEAARRAEVENKTKKAQEAAEAKARAAAIKEDNKTYLKQMLAALRNGEYDRAAAIADLDAMKTAGLLEDDEHKSRIKVLDAAEASYADERSKAMQKERDKAASGTGGGSKGNNYTYYSFGTGKGGVNINKNDVNRVADAYDMVPEEYGGGNPILKPAEKAAVVESYLVNGPESQAKENVKNHMKQVARRDNTAKPQKAKRKSKTSI